MKLLFVIDSLGPGGAQRQLALLAGTLHANGNEVTIFTYYPHHAHYRPELAAAGVRIIDGRKDSRFDLRPASELRRLLRHEHYDAAVAFLRTPSLYLLAARGLKRRPPVIVSERSSSPSGSFSPAAKFQFAAYRMADSIVPNSHFSGQQIAEAFPFLRERICVINNGVDLTRFPATEPAWAVGGRAFRFLVGARMGPEKNALTVLDAMVLLKQRGVPVPHVTWVGADDPSDNGRAYAAEVNRHIAQNALAPHWTRLPRSNDIPRLLAECDGAILASSYEGTPNFVCEALACGRPVIASAVGDIPALLKDSGGGFLFPSGNPAAMADAIIKLQSSDTATYRKMCVAARTFAEQNLSAASYVMRWQSLLTRVIRPSEK